MDFARKQLEKYGWTDGKGLGKNENGISQALKPKLKRSVTGVGHDPASEFNEHWWTALYDKAAGNVEIHEKNGKTKKIKTKDDNEFEITNSTWKLKKKQRDPENDEQYSEFFVRTAVLTSDGSKTEKVRESDSEEEEGAKGDVFAMTDEQLFAACEGRTAHKGARHGLKALGKLARIAQQEAILLAQPKYNGYSHAKNIKDKIQAVEDMNLNSDSEVTERKRKKKKRKRCNSDDKSARVIQCNVAESIEESLHEKSEMTDDCDVATVIKEDENCKKYNKLGNSESVDGGENIVKTKKKKKRKSDELIDSVCDAVAELDTPEVVKKSKKKKTLK